MIFSETNSKIAPALVKAWAEIETPKYNSKVSVKTKTGGSYTFEYTDLNGILVEAKNVFKENGIAIMQNSYTEIAEGAKYATVETLLIHSSGEYAKSEPLRYPIANSMQDFGGQLTYMKRYSLSAMLGIATEKDDDANGASGNAYTHEKTKSDTPSNLISAAQIKALGAKVGNISKANGQDQAAVYASACKHFGINKATKELTKAEASKIIDYLAQLEG